MKKFFRQVRGEFQKIRHTPMLWIHILVPVIGVILFLSYYSFLSINNTSKVQGYMEVLSVAFPLLIGIITAMAVDQEALAGNFQELLMAEGKLTSFFSKICVLLIMSFGALLIAVGGFALGFKFFLHQNTFSIAFYGKMILILFSSQIFLYILHTICSFQFGTGASIGLGIAESLIAALMLTGLGEAIWKWIPCSFGGRLCDYYMEYNTSKGDIYIFLSEFESGALICLVITAILLLSSFIWFYYYEGRKEN